MNRIGESLKNKRVLITQSNDFMGPSLCKIFSNHDCEVIASPEPLISTTVINNLEKAAGDFDRRAEPPKIEPLPGSESRPLWSVMIPVFNCAHLLEQSLKSVLAQDPGADRMQIEVIDDCSTKDDPARVVEEIGKGRVSFYRQPQNGGAINNFNTCIKRSRGKLVHILHGDDWIEPPGVFGAPLVVLARVVCSAVSDVVGAAEPVPTAQTVRN
jgi:hypothetical protein